MDNVSNVRVHIISHLTGSPPQTHHSSSPQKFAPPYHTHVCTNNLSQQWLYSKPVKIPQIRICKCTQDKTKLLLIMFSPYCFTCYQETYLPNEAHDKREQHVEGGRSGKGGDEGGVREGDGGGEGGGGSSTSDEAVLLVTFCKFPFIFVSCVNKYSNLKHSPRAD